LTQRGRYPGGRKSHSGVQVRRPNKGSSGRTPKLILILEMDVKLTFYGGKIESAYMFRCFLKRTHAAVLSNRYAIIDIHKTLMYVHCVQLNIRIGGGGGVVIWPSPTVNFGGHASPTLPWLTPMRPRLNIPAIKYHSPILATTIRKKR